MSKYIVTVKLQKTMHHSVWKIRSLIALFDFFYSAFNNWNHLHHVCSIFLILYSSFINLHPQETMKLDSYLYTCMNIIFMKMN